MWTGCEADRKAASPNILGEGDCKVRRPPVLVTLASHDARVRARVEVLTGTRARAGDNKRDICFVVQLAGTRVQFSRPRGDRDQPFLECHSCRWNEFNKGLIRSALIVAR